MPNICDADDSTALEPSSPYEVDLELCHPFFFEHS